MRFKIKQLIVQAKQSTEQVDFEDCVTFIYGPVGTGKSTVARLIDYCLGGDLERTPAVQQEFLSAKLSIEIGSNSCVIERGADDNQLVRVTWTPESDALVPGEGQSVNAPLTASTTPIWGEDVFSLSDLLFHLCEITPMRVRKRTRDPESPMIRLGFRDLWRYCYLDQSHLDSSFYRLEDPFRGRKSQDAMRFFTGLYSEELSRIETELLSAVDEQRGKREAVKQIREFMDRFELGSELDVAAQLRHTEEELANVVGQKNELEQERSANTHPSDELRQHLRELSSEIDNLIEAAGESKLMIEEQKALRAELITAKIKSERSQNAAKLLEGVEYERCPQCGTNVAERQCTDDACRLCGSEISQSDSGSGTDLEIIRIELNNRIDQITDSIDRRQLAFERSIRRLKALQIQKQDGDRQLQEELSRYDSAYVESIRALERQIATLTERVRSIQKLKAMPEAINQLQDEAGALEGTIDVLKAELERERSRLNRADENVKKIELYFSQAMLAVKFPGVSEDDDIVLSTRNWRPAVVHGEQEWDFWDAGSGGKKTLFNVCYALAVHEVARKNDLPVPSVLIIDSPTKNISDDENPELVKSLYEEIYRVAAEMGDTRTQFILIDSDIVMPEDDSVGFLSRRMAGEEEAPSLISYYDGP